MAAVFLGMSTHWKIYPVIYGVSCVCLIGSLSSYAKRKEAGWTSWFKVLVNPRTTKFTFVSAIAFGLLGALCYLVCVLFDFESKLPVLTIQHECQK